MKKVFLLINVIFLTQFFIGCVSRKEELYQQGSREISIMQLVTIENDINSGNKNNFSIESIKVLKNLSNIETKILIIELEKIRNSTREKENKIVSYPSGNGLLITYKDNEKTIMTLMEYDDKFLVYSAELSIDGEIIEKNIFLSSSILTPFEKIVNTLMEIV